jgi:dTDP-4-amino-4,6-dideoxygalactose transaminase
VVTNNSEIFEKIYQLHDHGRDTSGDIKSWGRNSRLDNLQAAILNKRFTRYQEVIVRRREIAALYQAHLGKFEELELPPAPEDSSNHFDVFQNYELQADKRDDLKVHLSERGIGTIIQWGGKGVHQWEGLGFTQKLPKVERFFERSIMLPMNMFISNEDVLYICDSIKNFYRN